LPPKPKTPRVSVNQLAKYLTATPRGRRTVVLDSKNPPAFKASWYEAARDAISQFARTGFEDERPLEMALDKLAEATPGNEHEQLVIANDIEALESFLNTYHNIVTDELAITAAPRSTVKLTYEGVRISVRPEILLQGTYRGNEVAGAVKLHFGKTRPLTKDSASYVGALVLEATKNSANGSVSRRHCQVYDVLSGVVYPSPTAVTTRLRDIKAACAEIRLMWEAV